MNIKGGTVRTFEHGDPQVDVDQYARQGHARKVGDDVSCAGIWAAIRAEERCLP